MPPEKYPCVTASTRLLYKFFSCSLAGLGSVRHLRQTAPLVRKLLIILNIMSTIVYL